MEKNSNCTSTTNDIPFSPSLNLLPSPSSSKNYLSKGILQTYEGEIVREQQKYDLISESEFSIVVEEEVLSPSLSCDSYINIQEHTLSPRVSDKSSIAIFSRLSQNQKDRHCTHIILQKNEKLEEGHSALASEVGGYVCQSETASQNYVAQIRREPTTIVITRRGSTNSLTAVGNCARFRAGGSDLENPPKRNKSNRSVAEDDKVPLTVWQREDTGGRLSSTSGESVTTRSSADTVPKKKKDSTGSYFKRLSSRLSDGGRRSRTSKSRGRSQPIEMTDKRLKSKIDKSMTPTDPKYFGPGRNSAYEGDGEENANKSEGSNKREGRSRSFFSRSKPRSRSRSTSKSKSQSPKRVSSKTDKKSKTGSETFYTQEPGHKTSCVTESPKRTLVSDKQSQVPKSSRPSSGMMDKSGCCCCDQIPPFQNQQIQTDSSGPACCSCDAPIPPFQNQQIQTDSSGPSCCACQMPPPPFQNQEIQTDSPRSGCCCCGMSAVKPKPQRDNCQPKCGENKPNRKNVLSVKSDVRSSIAYEAFLESYGSETPNSQTPGPPNQSLNSKPPGMDESTGGISNGANSTKKAAESNSIQPSQTQTSDEVRVYCSNCGCGLPKGQVPKAPGATAPSATTPSATVPTKEGISCDQCGCAASSNKGNFNNAAPPQDDNVSQVLWALAKVTVFTDGTRNFEILESTSIPPGHYLMRGNEEFMLVPVTR